MQFDFDTPVDRHGTDCLKFDFARERGRAEDALSYWVADMDFRTDPHVVQALVRRAQDGVFGYTDVKPHYFEAVRSWYLRRFGYDTRQDWLCVTPGIVFALAAAIHAFTERGQGVLIQSPVYYPFADTVLAAKRTVVSSPLCWNGSRYEVDFDDFEQKIVDGGVKLFLLCNPHNPGGTSWSRDELMRMGTICKNHGVIVLSDEIHSDFVWKPEGHVMFASVCAEFEAMTITCTSPTKTFNLAGLQVSNVFVADPALRRTYRRAIDALGYSQPNTLGLVACEAAYTHGDEWLEQARSYICQNFARTVDMLNGAGLGLDVRAPQATYLLWIDCRPLGIADTELNRIIKDEAGLWLDAGRIFGAEGECFERVNVATSWQYLGQGMERLVAALKAHVA